MKVILVLAYLVVSVTIVIAVPPIVRSFPEYGNFSSYDAGQAVLVWLLLAMFTLLPAGFATARLIPRRNR